MTAPQGQVPVTVRTFAQRFSATRRGARLARLLAVHQLTAWGFAPGVGGYDAAIVVVAELAANAALHGRVPGRDFGVRLAYDERSGVLEIEVSDTHEKCPVPKAPTSEDEEGRGLMLVEAVADRWGIRERRGPGKTVWARITQAR
ncbi:ATP-binding protein [Streptomyces sp. NPDC059455]|uniref:ATP-binding protein n=1 Tax=Streptomyces sp. NPDC059455 TaxID=3346837 RepID=UPI00368A7C2F